MYLFAQEQHDCSQSDSKKDAGFIDLQEEQECLQKQKDTFKQQSN